MKLLNHKLFMKEMQHATTYLELMSLELKDFEFAELSEECRNISEKLALFIQN